MLENHVIFAVPPTQRTQISCAVATEARGVTPFRLQQVVFDTADGSCVERGLYLIVHAGSTTGAEGVHRAVQPLTVCTNREHAWPQAHRVFNATRLQELLASDDAGMGPPFETPPVLLPRRRIVSRGRRGLFNVPDGSAGEAVVEVIFQRSELRTATTGLSMYSLTMNLLAGAPSDLFAVAADWQRRFALTLDPHPAFVQAARLGAGKRRRPRRFNAPVWLPGRTMAETANYPAVNEVSLLAAALSDLVLTTCAIAEGDADEQRLQGFENTVHAIACLLDFRAPLGGNGAAADLIPARLYEPLQKLQARRLQESSLRWLQSSLQAESSQPLSPLATSLLQLAIEHTPTSLRTLAVQPETRAWVFELLAWANASLGFNEGEQSAPDLTDQAACRHRLENWLLELQQTGLRAVDGDARTRRVLWQQLSRFDEALNQFGSILPRRLMLRYRMVARAALGPLTEWLNAHAMIIQLPALIEAQTAVFPGAAEDFQRQLLDRWHADKEALEPRVVTQLQRLAQAAGQSEERRMPRVM